jgi:RHS repeat-associated protein
MPSSPTILLTKGSGTVLGFSGPDVNGYYTPLDLDRNSLMQSSDGTFVETQPDGFALHYGQSSSSSSSSSYSSSSGSSYSTSSSSYAAYNSILYILCGYSPSSQGPSPSSSLSSSSQSSSSSSSSGSSGSSSSCSCSPMGEIELGFVRNLLPADFAVPHLGLPIDSTGRVMYANQPLLCTIDQECTCEPSQPLAGLYNGDVAWSLPVYSHDGRPNSLDRAFAIIRSLVRGYNLPVRLSGLNCGALVDVVCQMNLATGNLVVSLSLPAAGPAAPPMRFYYNSLSTQLTEYGFGWTGLYQQYLSYPGSSSSSSSGACDVIMLSKLVNQAGQTWQIQRLDGLCGPISQITNPFGAVTQFNYASGNLQNIVDETGRIIGFSVDSNGDLTEIFNPDGSTTQFTYNEVHQMTSWSTIGASVENNTTTFTYDCCGRLSEITTPTNNTTSIGYPGEYTRVITDPLMNVTTITIDTDGNIIEVLDPESRTFLYSWNSNQRLASTTDPALGVTTFTYTMMSDYTERLTGITRPIGSWAFAYSSTSVSGGGYAVQLNSITDPNSNTATIIWDSGSPYERDTLQDNDTTRTYSYDYDSFGHLTELTDALGHQWSWSYDTSGRRTSYAASSLSTSNIVYYGYSSSNQVQTIINALGQGTFMIYDPMNRITTGIDADGNTTTYNYDFNGRLTQVIDGLGNNWLTGYDSASRKTSTTDGNGFTTTYVWDGASNLTLVNTPAGRTNSYQYDYVYRLHLMIEGTSASVPVTTQYYYDDTSRQFETIMPTSRIWTQIYDGNWRLTQAIDPLSRTTTYTYDSIGNQTSVTQPLTPSNLVTSFNYNPQCQRTTFVDANSHTTVYAYDVAGNLYTTTDATSALTTFNYDQANRRINMTDPNVHTTTYAWDAANRRTAVTDPNNHTTAYDYDPAGNLLTTTDPNNNTTTYAYDACNQLTSTTSPLISGTGYYYIVTTNTYDPGRRLTNFTDGNNHTTTYAYDMDNNLTGVTDPLNHTTAKAYDPVGRLSSIQTPLGHLTTFAYDQSSRLTSQTDANGNITTYVFDSADQHINTLSPSSSGVISLTWGYDTAGRVTSIANGLGLVTAYTLDGVGNKLGITTPLGFITTYTYDNTNALKSIWIPTNSSSQLTTYNYDPGHRLTSTTTPLGFLTTYAYDAGNRLTSTQNSPDGSTVYTTSQGYDPANNLTAVTDPRGYTTTYGYDTVNRRISSTDPYTQTTAYAFDAASNLTSIQTPALPSGKVTTFVYDNANRKTAWINPAGDTTTYVYDNDSNMTNLVTPLTFVTTFQYDNVRNLTAQITPLGAGSVTTTFAYDGSNRRTGATDAQTNTTAWKYDLANRLTAVVDGNSHTTTYNYDNDNRMISLVNPNSHTTAFAYDNAARKTQMVAPLTRTTNYAYDIDSRMITMLDPLSHTTTYNWDDLGRLTGEHFASAESFSYAYDQNSNLTSMTDPTGTSAWTFDNNNCVSVQQDSAGITTTFSYDANSRMTQRILGTVGTFNYVYDYADRLLTLSNPASETTTQTWDADSRLTQRKLADGVTCSYSYDNANNLTQVANLNSSSVTLSSFGYTYNNVGKRLTVTDINSNITTYTYDGIYQVLSTTIGAVLNWVDLTSGEWETLTSYQWSTLLVDPGNLSQSTTYDANGNALTIVTPSGTLTNVYDAADQLNTSTPPGGVTTAYTYDNLGRRTTMVNGSGTTTYTWDDDNRLAGVSLPGTSATLLTFTYDGKGMRFSRQTGSGTTKYSWNGQVLSAETNSGGTVETWYTQAQGLFGDIASVRTVTGSTSSFPLYDSQGNATNFANSSASITSTLTYDTFGNIVDESGITDPTVSWSGRQGYYYDNISNLYYIRQRWYDPVAQRFLTQDPLGFGGGDTNLFRYAGNDPINNDDPSGQDETDEELNINSAAIPLAMRMYNQPSNTGTSNPTSAYLSRVQLPSAAQNQVALAKQFQQINQFTQQKKAIIAAQQAALMQSIKNQDQSDQSSMANNTSVAASTSTYTPQVQANGQYGGEGGSDYLIYRRSATNQPNGQVYLSYQFIFHAANDRYLFVIPMAGYETQVFNFGITVPANQVSAVDNSISYVWNVVQMQMYLYSIQGIRGKALAQSITIAAAGLTLAGPLAALARATAPSLGALVRFGAARVVVGTADAAETTTAAGAGDIAVGAAPRIAGTATNLTWRVIAAKASVGAFTGGVSGLDSSISVHGTNRQDILATIGGVISGGITSAIGARLPLSLQTVLSFATGSTTYVGIQKAEHQHINWVNAGIIGTASALAPFASGSAIIGKIMGDKISAGMILLTGFPTAGVEGLLEPTLEALLHQIVPD